MPRGVIESLDHEARGITRLEGKTVFVEGALPGETVDYVSIRSKPTYEIARTERIVKESSYRVSPKCPHYGVCGGCSMQHLDSSAQVAAKQRLLESNLRHLGKLKAEQLYAPVYGAAWGYRSRARFSVFVPDTAGLALVGFHERKSSNIAEIRQCGNLLPHVSALIMPLRELVSALSIKHSVPQIEIAVGEEVTVLVLRILESLKAADENLVRAFADKHDLVVYLQPKGPASAVRFYPSDGRKLYYCLPDYNIEHCYSPTEFTQVNSEINRVLVRRAMALLDPQSGERIADMFCGLGNFSLPIARLGASVVGVEGNRELVRRAAENAAANGLRELAKYEVANLFEITPKQLKKLGHFDKMLIDPPREGAIELVKALDDVDSESAQSKKPVRGLQRIVYVSCNPSTLARDSAILVRQKGYRLRGAGVVNMFPNTSHVESIALFEK